jgi:subtilase family serine protease
MLGETATLHAGVENIGDAPAGRFILAAWPHRPEAPVVGSPRHAHWEIDGLAPGASAHRSLQFTPRHPGVRIAYAHADATDVIREPDERNNIAHFQYEIIGEEANDLVGGVRVEPNPIRLGDTATLHAGVENIGDAPAGRFILAAWAHRPDDPVVGSPPHAHWEIDGLAPGESAHRRFDFTPQHPGIRVACVHADATNVIREPNERNNIAHHHYEIISGEAPDLLGAVRVEPNPIRLGETATLHAGVENIGEAPAGRFMLAAWPHRPAEPVVGSPPHAHWEIDGLAPGASVHRHLEFTPYHQGMRVAWTHADITNVIREPNEHNNIAHYEYEIIENMPGPVAVTAASAMPTAGGQVAVAYSLSSPATVTLQVRNVAGRTVARSALGGRPSGAHLDTWSGLSSTGTRVPAGMYWCEVLAQTAAGGQARAVAPVRIEH